MDNKKIILTDLDGTFVMDSHSVAKNDLKAFNELSRNYILGIATGRSIKEINYLEKENDIFADIKVGFNGSIISGFNNEILVDEPLPKEALIEILQYLKDNNIVFDALDGLKRVGSYKATDKKRLWGMDLITMSDPYETVSNMKVYKINARPGEKRFTKFFTELKMMFPELSIYEGGTQQRIEISASGCSKGTAVDAIRNRYNRDVIVVGDSGNDAPMFERANMSFCISHAKNVVKNKADYGIDNFSDLTKYLLSSYEVI